jgi:hypothetical protein
LCCKATTLQRAAAARRDCDEMAMAKIMTLTLPRNIVPDTSGWFWLLHD